MSGALLKAIAAWPAGEKLPVSRLAREFNSTPAVIMAEVQELIGAGKLDRLTLRPPAPPSVPPIRTLKRRGDTVPAATIQAEVAAFLKRSGMSRTAFSLACLHGRANLRRLELATHVRAKTIAAIRDYIAGHNSGSAARAEAGAEGCRVQSEQAAPAGEPESGGGVGHAIPAPSPSITTAEALLAEIDDYCGRTGTPAGFVGKVAFNHPGFVPLLRKRGTLTAKSATTVRDVLATFPNGIPKADAFHQAHRESEQAARRREQLHAAPFDRKGEGLERESGARLAPSAVARPTGQQLHDDIEAAAKAAGVPLNRFILPAFPSITFLKNAERPRPKTVARVRALIVGEIRAEETPRNVREKQDGRAILLDRQIETEGAVDERLPGETLADAVKRHAGEREARHREASRLTTRNPLEVDRFCGAPSQPNRGALPLEADDDELGELSADRRRREQDELASPSSVLRRAQQDWPDQCEKVKAIAAELGVTLGEAWRRVIAAGVDCLADPEAI